jgi:hypothetical protein
MELPIGARRYEMQLAKSLSQFLSRTWGMGPKLPEPAFDPSAPRDMTGFFANLSPEQKARALEYRGDETFGDDRFAKRD